MYLIISRKNLQAAGKGREKMGAKKWARKKGAKKGREKRVRKKGAKKKGAKKRRELEQLDHLEKDSFNLVLFHRLH